MTRFKTWLAYEKAFASSVSIFEISKTFPREEQFSLTDQIRRSSRSVCANLAECYAKRKYKAVFLLKLSDALAENNETICWLDFALQAKYLTEVGYRTLYDNAIEINKLLGFMIRHPEKFLHTDLNT